MKAFKLSIVFFFRTWLSGFLLFIGNIILTNNPELMPVVSLQQDGILILLFVSFVFSLPVLPPLFFLLLTCSPWRYPKAYAQVFLGCVGLFLSYGWMRFISLLEPSVLNSELLLPFVYSAILTGVCIHQSKLFHKLCIHNPQSTIHV